MAEVFGRFDVLGGRDVGLDHGFGYGRRDSFQNLVVIALDSREDIHLCFLMNVKGVSRKLAGLDL